MGILRRRRHTEPSGGNDWAKGLTDDQQNALFQRREQADLWVLPWTPGDESSTWGITSIFAKSVLPRPDHILYMLLRTLAPQVTLVTDEPVVLEANIVHVRWQPEAYEANLQRIAHEGMVILSALMGFSIARVEYLDPDDHLFQLFLRSTYQQ